LTPLDPTIFLFKAAPSDDKQATLLIPGLACNLPVSLNMDVERVAFKLTAQANDRRF
jgi:hypothetical protein